MQLACQVDFGREMQEFQVLENSVTPAAMRGAAQIDAIRTQFMHTSYVQKKCAAS